MEILHFADEGRVEHNLLTELDSFTETRYALSGEMQMYFTF